MPKQPSITIVGAGKLGSALALLLRQAGYRIDEIVVRDTGSVPRVRRLAAKVRGRAVAISEARLAADVLWIAVPDDNIRACAVTIAKTNQKLSVVLHSSGALSSEVLKPLRKNGAAIGSLHPLMSFVKGPPPLLDEVLFSMEGDAKAVMVARRIARALGGIPFVIDANKKPLYHAFGAFTSPLLVAHLSAAETLGVAAGMSRSALRKAMRPIIRRTLDNYFEHGATAAFSGPLVRGDVETVRKHLEALKGRPEKNLYIALVENALKTLPVANASAIRQSTRK